MDSKLKEGWEAVNLLKSELLQRTLGDIQNNLVKEWMSTTSPDDRERLWGEQRGVTRFKNALKNRLVTVVIATNNAELKRELKNIEKRY